MPGALRISEAASLAMHTAALLAEDAERPVSAREIAVTLRVSEAHLAKVMQRLAKFGLVRSFRGPAGGFVLSKDCGQITLLDVYEAIEGPLEENHCLFETPVCRGEICVLGGLIGTVNRQVRDYLAGARLSALTDIYERTDTHAEKSCEDR